MNFVKHCFEVHSVEPTFRFVCGINGCVHYFSSGSTFSSFKSHASCKHPNWQECFNGTSAGESCDPTSFSSTDELLANETCEYETTVNDVEPVISMDCDDLQALGHPSAQRTAALFLLTFQEKHRLNQTAINFAVGSINTIVDSVCMSVERSVLELAMECPAIVRTRLAECFEHEDPFASLQTEYQQTKFYQEEFGLVVNSYILTCCLNTYIVMYHRVVHMLLVYTTYT